MKLNQLPTEIEIALKTLELLNPGRTLNATVAAIGSTTLRTKNLQKVLVDNRGEIGKRFFLALHEEGIPSVAVVTDVDKGQSWYEFADEVVYIGDETNYTNIPLIVAAALLSGANAVYSGYGFLSENPALPQAIDRINELLDRKIIFMGPSCKVMQIMGDKVSACALAKKHNVPLFESSEPLKPQMLDEAKRAAAAVGYPVIVKLSAGGGGKGMQAVFNEDELVRAIDSCCRIGQDLYGNSTFYLEKFIQRPIHIEVQVFNGRAIGIRKCAVQRRNQKIIEESGHTFLEDYMALSFLSAAERLAIVSGYSTCGAGTVEFLIDDATGKFGFMEMNTRLQVEYGVTDQSLGIDLAKWQILYFDGRESEIQGLDTIKYRVVERQHAIECRIYAEEPENDYLPSPGTIRDRVLPTFNGIRCDFGFGVGDKILSAYDPMIGKIIAHGPTRKEALIRLERALQELYIKGVKTNVNQLLRIVRHPEFKKLGYTNSLIAENPTLGFQEKKSTVELDLNKSYNLPPILGAFAEYLLRLDQSAKTFKISVGLEGVLSSPIGKKVPASYQVVSGDADYQVEFLQTAMDSFHAYLNGVYFGKLHLLMTNVYQDDLYVSIGPVAKRIKLDRYVDSVVLRMRDGTHKVDYYRMSINPEGVDEEDRTGAICSPFQGSFVSFCRDDLRVGKSVKAGEAIMILSAMKMETVMQAPCDGRISFIIEDADLSRLQIAKTADGRIIGKSLSEGELLVKIEKEKKEELKVEVKKSSVIGLQPMVDHPLQIILADDFQARILDNVDRHIDTIIELYQGVIFGFVTQPELVEKLISLVRNISPIMWKRLLNVPRTDEVNRMILHYTYIMRLFSPTISDEGFSYPEEFALAIKSWPDVELELSSDFKVLLKDILSAYGISELKPGTDSDNAALVRLFQIIKQSYIFCRDQWPKIGNNVNIAGNLNPSSGLTILTLKRLISHTQKKLDDTSSSFIKSVIAKYFPDTSLDIFGSETDSIAASPATGPTKSGLAEFYSQSLEKPQEELIPPEVGGSRQALLSERIKYLEGKFKVSRLASGVANTYIYRLESPTSGAMQYLSITFLDFGQHGFTLETASALVRQAAMAVAAYHQIKEGKSNRIEFIVESKQVVWDRDNDDLRYINYRGLRNLLNPSRQCFFVRSIAKGLIETDVAYPGTTKVVRRHIVFSPIEDSLRFELIDETNKLGPYYAGKRPASPQDEKMYDLGKWPIESWAEECFDFESMEEILIDSIDRNPNGTKVGSKIFIGKIQGAAACFYMKDYRIIGGATGDLEGLKYGAATYLAFMKGWPLYVWNDSAGANVKQGVVSLNRGGQGFMMNSLLADDVQLERFKRHTNNVYDPKLKEVFAEIDTKFTLNATDNGKPRSSIIIAVGIGASAGLDVYGSSQATIQLVLDAKTSYRVLTGSNVIKSVLGEDISNYDIGGAKILGKWTGTVDLVAKDKLDLISKVFQIQKLFTTAQRLPAIRRTPQIWDEKSERYQSLVMDRNTIRNNVDDGKFIPFRSDYYGSNALLGGFACLGGIRALILGVRTDSGLTGVASIIKARELFRVARRTGTPQILIYGATFMKMVEDNAKSRTRPALDLMNAMASNRDIRVHIITKMPGLKEVYVNSSADAIIFVKKDKYTEAQSEFIEMNSTFVVESFTEAFDVVQRILDLTSKTSVGSTVSEHALAQPSARPQIPRDRGEPYDMLKSVIEPITDRGSFIEFYREMNRPAGPNLITGLARFKGKTIGIIADKPEIKGGGADAPGAEKFRVFVEFLNKRQIPLLMLSNSSGFVPGTQQERMRIQAIGAESLDANILGEIPVVSVVLNQVYGGRQIQAFSKSLRPGIVYLALEDALMAVMGENAAFDLLGAKKYNEMLAGGSAEMANNYRHEFVTSFVEKAKAGCDAMSTGILDWTIPDIGDLAVHIDKGLDLAISRCQESFGYLIK